MPAKTRTMFHGNLDMSTDAFFLINGTAPNHLLLLSDGTSPGQEPGVLETVNSRPTPHVSIVGRFLTEGEVDGPGPRFVLEKFVTHESIAGRAFEIFTSSGSGSAEADWLRAERELLGL
ncbi:DUF2934 domain-containing protein [Paludisphaera rhizosphaerae]|uniref:DUF2934 domain-containing protein n=1 Tax=Paludisphaera rhizosphaerae TaxID=2711216 RepID=UPI0019800354|nr:DUF2934 domain-containing protein [Paludisphaera rhizosphaerae]